MASPAELMPAARESAQRAIHLAPHLAEAHASLADVFLHFDRNWAGADQEYRRAIECNPGYALSYHWYANLLAAKGHHEAARIAIAQALEIDPVCLITVVWAGVTAHMARQYDRAISHHQNALELNPQFVWAHMYMAQALEQKGDYPGALREFETTTRLVGGNNSVEAMKAQAHAIAGDRPSAQRILDTLCDPAQRRVPSYDIAAVYAALGESGLTVDWLTRACEERNMKLFTLNQDPRFDPQRDSSGFQSIVTRVGLNADLST
jgi:tetratricopeptide (TPR) repeat protein